MSYLLTLSLNESSFEQLDLPLRVVEKYFESVIVDEQLMRKINDDKQPWKKKKQQILCFIGLASKP